MEYYLTMFNHQKPHLSGLVAADLEIRAQRLTVRSLNFEDHRIGCGFSLFRIHFAIACSKRL